MEAFGFLIVILTAIISINSILQFIIYLQTKDRSNLYQTLYWISSFFNLLCVSILQEGTFPIIFAQATAMPSIIFLIIVATSFTNIRPKFKTIIVINLITLASSYLLTTVTPSFTLAALPVSLSIGLPLLYFGGKIFKHYRGESYLKFSLSILLIMFGALHSIIPFIRMYEANNLWAFTLYFSILQGFTMLFPALTTVSKDKKRSQELRREVAQKTRELKQTIEMKDITYQVLVHDFSNYVFAIISSLRSLHRSGLNEEQKHIIEKDSEILNKMKCLITEVRNLERTLKADEQGEINFTYHNLKGMISELIESFEERLNKKKITIVDNTMKGLDLLVYEPFFSTSILGNYLSNAIKFSKENMNITLSTELTDDKTLLIRITDKGIGIPEGDVQKLNSSSSPTKREGTHNEKSTGLGTLIANNYLKIHGLKSTFDSIEAQELNDFVGETTITINFPRNKYRIS